MCSCDCVACSIWIPIQLWASCYFYVLTCHPIVINYDQSWLIWHVYKFSTQFSSKKKKKKFAYICISFLESIILQDGKISTEEFKQAVQKTCINKKYNEFPQVIDFLFVDVDITDKFNFRVDFFLKIFYQTPPNLSFCVSLDWPLDKILSTQSMRWIWMKWFFRNKKRLMWL